MSQRILTESKHPIYSKVIKERVQMADGATRLRVKGPGSSINRKNENNRRYGKSVWEKNLSEGSELTTKMKQRSVLGEMEHPESGQTDLKRVSHIIENAYIQDLKEDNEYGVPAGEWVIIEALILNNEWGKQLQELYAVGVPVGVSSRGRGDVQEVDGVDEVCENYICDTWDFVASPSVVEARPVPVTEDAKKRKEQPTEWLRDVAGRAKKALDEAATCDLASLSYEQLVEAGTTLGGLYEALRRNPNWSGLTESKAPLLENLRSKISEVASQVGGRIDTAGIFLQKTDRRPIVKKPLNERKDTPVSTTATAPKKPGMTLADAMKMIDSLTKRLAKAAKPVAEGADAKTAKVLATVQERYDAAVDMLDTLRNRATSIHADKLVLEAKLAKLTKLYKAASKAGESIRKECLSLQKELASVSKGKGRQQAKPVKKTAPPATEAVTPKKLPGTVRAATESVATSPVSAPSPKTQTAVAVADPAGNMGRPVQPAKPASLMEAVIAQTQG